MEAYFSNLFEDGRYERSPILLPILVEPDIMKQSNIFENEVYIIKAREKNFRQGNLEEYVAMDLLEKQFSN